MCYPKTSCGIGLNSKSHTSLALPFSSTEPRSHLSLYHTVSSPISSYSFFHATAKIISARLCLVRYSLFANTLQPATRCSTVSLQLKQILHLPSSISPSLLSRLLFQPFAQSSSKSTQSFVDPNSVKAKGCILVLVLQTAYSVVLCFCSFQFFCISFPS